MRMSMGFELLPNSCYVLQSLDYGEKIVNVFTVSGCRQHSRYECVKCHPNYRGPLAGWECK